MKYFKDLELRVEYLSDTENVPNDACWSIAYDIYGHGDFSFCSAAVADYIIRKVEAIKTGKTIDNLLWNMINCLV